MGRDDVCVPLITEYGFTINGCTFNVDRKYHPIDAIGQGSYGVVCSVRNTETKEKLAIKKIMPMAGDEWDATHTLREIRLMRCLGAHENIISLKDLSMCKDKDELYMMMELADTDLHRLIQSSCPLTEGHIRVIMYQLLSGVKAMHDNGVLHRDLKPGNLLLNKDCELKITDFGLARMMPKNGPQQTAEDQVSMMTEYVVTRWYRPPELMLAPNGTYDGAIDMWSVGCILGELVSRRPLFPGTDFMDQLTRVFQVLPVPDPDDRGYVIENDALKFLSSLPVPPIDALETKFSGTIGSQALDLLRHLLCFNPKERISADTALNHPFLTGVQDEWGAIHPLHLAHSLEFAFDTQSLPLATLRAYITDEVEAFSHGSSTPQREPQELEPQRVKVDGGTSQDNNDSPPGTKPETGTGFSLNGCAFHVPSKYRPLRVLGEGSYGIVCAAVDTETNTNVAIKKITPMAGDAWDAKHTLREIRLMRYFGNHPNIASLENLSTWVEHDELYLMMQLVDTDLHRLIQSKTKLEDTHIAAILYQLLCGAHTLHANGVLHRDLKPGNILVSKACDVQITDFGLSRYVPLETRPVACRGVHGTEAVMTEYVVTRWYRPPEIMLAPTGVYTEAVDMWSIGCIFGELLTRRPLFPGTDFLDQLARIFALLPVPSRDQRGYDVEGDALAYLERLPPCSPNAFTNMFPTASSEAMNLLRRFLCINPAERISAKEALDHAYFQKIRTQLGAPPDYWVDHSFEFEFDVIECSLDHLKTLIQKEVQEFAKVGLLNPRASSEGSKSCTKPLNAWEAQDGRQEAASDTLPVRDKGEMKSLEPEEDHESERLETQDVALTTLEQEGDKPQAMASRDVASRKVSTRSMIRPKSAFASRISSTNESKRRGLNRPAHDTDDVVSVASITSTNRPLQGNHGQESTRWAIPSTTSSRLDRSTYPILSTDRHGKSTSQRLKTQSTKRGTETLATSLLKTEARRGPDRVHSTLTAATASSQRRQSTSGRALKSAPVVPEGWVRRTHSKSGRVYYYNPLTQVASWKNPGLEPCTATPSLASPSTSLASESTAGVASTPSTSCPSARPASSSQLPKEWVRQSDPITGRLFYVNLLTKRSYAKLPSAVTAAMLNLGTHHAQQRHAVTRKKKPTIPQSPQFTQMSWQRKAAH